MFMCSKCMKSRPINDMEHNGNCKYCEAPVVEEEQEVEVESERSNVPTLVKEGDISKEALKEWSEHINTVFKYGGDIPKIDDKLCSRCGGIAGKEPGCSWGDLFVKGQISIQMPSSAHLKLGFDQGPYAAEIHGQLIDLRWTPDNMCYNCHCKLTAMIGEFLMPSGTKHDRCGSFNTKELRDPEYSDSHYCDNCSSSFTPAD